MTLELTTKQWQKAIKELVRVTKPGGWIELGRGFSENSSFLMHEGLGLDTKAGL